MSGIKSSVKKYIKPGKKTREWSSVRSNLKLKFEKWGITSCELRLPGCWVRSGLGFAHKDKRRNLKPEELYDVILACNWCHDKIEYTPAMRIVVEKVIEARKALLIARGEVV